MSILGELQRQNGGAWVELFEVDSTAQGGGQVYFHAGTNGLTTPVVWQGQAYEPFPIQATGFEVSGQQMPRPKLAVANVSGVITALLATGDLLGAKVTRRRTMVKYLDDVNFPIVQKPTPSVLTFTRSSTATYYDSDGKLKTASANTPRIDYDPQSARTNLLVRSAEFDNAAWLVGLYGNHVRPTVTANVSTAPDGTVTGDRLTSTHITASTIGSSIATAVAGTTYTISAWIKAGTATQARLVIAWGNSGTLVTFPATIVNLTSEFQRFTFSAVCPASGVNQVQANITIGNGTNGGEVGKTIEVWGAQLEYGSTATDYIPTTTAQVTRMDTVRGLLIEEQRTNLLVRSAEFDNASWTTVNATVTANAIAAPDGTLSADRLIENTANGTHEIAQFTTIATGTAYTASIYIKSLGRTRLRIQLDAARFPATALAFFDTSTGSPSNIGAGATAKMTSVGNGWYRCTLTATSTSAGGAGAYFTLSSTGTTTFYTGDGASGLYLWGAQFEAGAFATSYIPTTTAAVTRAADAANVPLANIMWNDSSSAMAVEFSVPWETPVISRGVVCVDSLGRLLYFSSGANNPAIYDGTNIISNAFVVTPSVAMKTSSTFDSSGMAICTNGGTVNSGSFDGTFGSSPTVLRIGDIVSGNQISGHIKRLRYYPRRLTNTELQSITGSGTVDDLPAFELDASTGALSVYTLAQYNPTADSNAHLADEIYYIAQKTQENHAVVEFELGSPIDLQGVTIPRRQIVANLCLWQYRGEGCGYAGGAVADANDQPTAVLANDKCSKRLSGCKLRFGDNNELPYGGFPSAGLVKF